MPSYTIHYLLCLLTFTLAWHFPLAVRTYLAETHLRAPTVEAAEARVGEQGGGVRHGERGGALRGGVGWGGVGMAVVCGNEPSGHWI